MKTTVLRKNEQAYGEFNGGAILERKPIGFPQDHGKLRPYSNLFYWAHAWSTGGGMIGEHPHKGFEILSFILEGTTHHYDSQLQGWKELHAGDVQIIRAGRGISHAERMEPNSALFQIWFDPGLERTLGNPATYNDHRAADFPATTTSAGKTTTYIGAGSPLLVQTPSLEVARTQFNNGIQALVSNGYLSGFVLGGTAKVGGDLLETGDFLLLEGGGIAEIYAQNLDLFVIKSPAKTDYLTYQEIMQRQFRTHQN